MKIAHTNPENKVEICHLPPLPAGQTVEEQAETAARKSGFAEGSWRIVSDEEAAELLRPSPAEAVAALIQSYMAKIQDRLDAFARTRSYDDARACVSVYLGCSNETFAAEAAYMQERIVATWEWANDFTNAVLKGEKETPASWDAFEADLATAVPLVWPVEDTRVTAV